LLLIQNGAAYDEARAASRSFVRALADTVQELHDGESLLLALVTRRGHVMGDFVLGGRELGTYYTLAWPAADLGVSDIPAFTKSEAKRIQGRGPWDAAGLAIVDDVVEPAETRERLAAILTLLARARAYPSAHTDRDGRIPYR
jgi:acetyl-CoA carboxylase carboxyltransferase component